MKSEWSQSAVEGYERMPFAAFVEGASSSSSSELLNPGFLGQEGRPEDLPGVPARIATRIALELMLQEPVIDLRSISAVVLEDPGATLEVLRLAAREGAAGERAERIEDALAGVSLAGVLEVTSRASFDRSGRLSKTWEHGHQVAIAMRNAAAVSPEILPEQAWMVGLLHEIGSLPGLLGWTLPAVCKGEAQGARLAEYWRLPRFLVSALSEIESRRSSSVWASLLRTAHRRAQAGDCSICVPAARPPRSRVLHFERSGWKAQRAVRPSVPA